MSRTRMVKYIKASVGRSDLSSALSTQVKFMEEEQRAVIVFFFIIYVV